MALMAWIWLLIIYTDTELSTRNSRYDNARDIDTFDNSTLANKQKTTKDLNNIFITTVLGLNADLVHAEAI